MLWEFPALAFTAGKQFLQSMALSTVPLRQYVASSFASSPVLSWVMTACEALFAEESDLYLDEIVTWLALTHDISISVSTLCTLGAFVGCGLSTSTSSSSGANSLINVKFTAAHILDSTMPTHSTNIADTHKVPGQFADYRRGIFGRCLWHASCIRYLDRDGIQE